MHEAGGQKKLGLGIEPMIEADLESGAEEEVTDQNRSEIEGEALAKGGRAAKGNLLNHGAEGDQTAIRVAREPGLVRIERKYVILLEVTIREVQERCDWANGSRHLFKGGELALR